MWPINGSSQLVDVKRDKIINNADRSIGALKTYVKNGIGVQTTQYGYLHLIGSTLAILLSDGESSILEVDWRIESLNYISHKRIVRILLEFAKQDDRNWFSFVFNKRKKIGEVVCTDEMIQSLLISEKHRKVTKKTKTSQDRQAERGCPAKLKIFEKQFRPSDCLDWLFRIVGLPLIQKTKSNA